MAGTFLNAGAPQYTQDSLPDLPAHSQSEAQLTAHLASRYHVALPTARLSSHALIAFNTFTSSALGPNGGKEGSAMGACEDLASRVWSRLGARAEDQAVVFLGESGSGKTTLRSHFLTSILSFSSTPLATKLSYAAFVFDTLTTTKSLTTPTASKAGLFYELQYDTGSASRPTLIGGKLLDHRLERSRIASVPTGERSFHALYYLLGGTSAAEKAHLGLESIQHHAAETLTHRHPGAVGSTQKRWRYLGHPTQLKVGIDDADGFRQFKTALRKLEFPRSDIAEICQVLATVLHIGQLEFYTTQHTTPSADDSGGYSHEGGEMVTAVKNRDVLAIVAAFLGVSIQDLETCLGYKTKTLYNERVTVMLDPQGARKNADGLARTLYSLLVTYVIESINQKVCAIDESVLNTVSIVDFPGFAPASATGSALEQLLNNSATEALYNFSTQSFFEQQSQFLESEEIQIPATRYFDNTDAVRGLLKQGNGLLSILDDQMTRGKTDIQFLEAIRRRFEKKNPAIEVGAATTVLPGSNFPTHNARASFTVRHYAGEVEYPVEGLMEDDSEIVTGDVVNLISHTKNDFVRSLFGQEALRTTSHPQEQSTIVQATLSSKPLRQPSVARRKTGRPTRFNTRKFDATTEAEEAGVSDTTRIHGRQLDKPTVVATQGAAGEFLGSLFSVTKSLSAATTIPHFVFCLKPNDRRIARQFDSKCVRSQIQTLGIAEMSQRLKRIDFSVFLPFGEFLGQAVDTEQIVIGSEKDKAEAVIAENDWPDNEARAGCTGVFLSERLWALTAKVNLHHGASDYQYLANPEHDGENGLHAPGNRYGLSESKVALLDATPMPYHDDRRGDYFRDNDVKSDAGASALQGGDLFRNLETREEMAEKGNEKKLEEVDQMTQTGSRKRWLFIVWMLTFYVPDFLIKKLGRIQRKDVRVAWREKLAINLLIWLACGFAIFFIVWFPNLICPKQNVFTTAELSSFDGIDGASAYVSIRGVVFDLGNFMQAHYPNIVSDYALERFAGADASGLFPVQVSAMCQGVDGSIDPAVQLTYQSANYSAQTSSSSAASVYAQYHDFRWATTDYRPTWFTTQMLYMRKNYYKGTIGFPPSYVKQLAEKNSYIAYMDNRVYDLTQYVAGGTAPQYPPGYNNNGSLPNLKYMDASVVDLFTQHSGNNIINHWNDLELDAEMKSRMKLCLDNLFYVGNLDTRGSIRCMFSRYLLLAVSLLLVTVIGFKFLAALQFGGNNIPENLDEFIICTVPAYTEDEDSLRRAIDSAARMRYDDKRKLLVIVCDGMIIGQGNDKPTPRIVLDILGVPETLDPEPLSFESLGEGMKQHNMAKCYSGLYEVQGHIVPFLVIVKVGKPSEVSRPGNRGKRDSQMILMRFLNRVHYNLPMTPLELEMHHQIRNIIGVNPTLFSYLLQIDADTVVAPDSAARFVAAFLHDTRLIGVCGETALSNAKASMVTMMQVYEYFISHNLTKAFESLFGSVTCLPGCFSMYRIRAADNGKPLFVSRDVVEAYSEIRVDTLHSKNLLHLGEDRFLTTLLLKYHGGYQTKYISRAQAWTIAPDSWKVFMSQRRRWINSTVHNLVELIPLQQLCGFCCFSMRFVVFLDLMSTLVQPVIVGYIAYLIVTVVRDPSAIPLTAFIMLAAIYGLQAIIFILRRKWDMIGWMIIYILATPVFALGLPLYAFWHMDDFSWGSTRVITGESGRQVVISDEGKFDPRSIPRKRWEEWQQELWESQPQHDDTAAGAYTVDDDDARSHLSGYTYATKANAWASHTALNPAAASLLHSPTRPQSRMYLDAPPPRYGSSMSLHHPTTAAAAAVAGAGYEMSEFGGNASPGVRRGSASATPSDDAILAEIRDFLRTADLMRVTKKTVKMEMERRFGVGMDAKRAYIGSATEAILAGAL